jgi:hypothetical protein
MFAVVVLGFSVMANHLHVVLRNRPSLDAEWSDDEIVTACGANSRRSGAFPNSQCRV